MPKTAVKTCFVIGPIGDPGTSTRHSADWLLKGIIRPILKEKFKFQVQRADEIASPGMIDSQVINAVIDADLVIADLSENNPNAFYELALRHMQGRPVIHMTREPKIPFDIQPYRTIHFSTVSPEDVDKAMVELEKQVNEALAPDHEVDNPVTTARGKKKWRETATDKEKVMLGMIDSLNQRVAAMESTAATGTLSLQTSTWDAATRATMAGAEQQRRRRQSGAVSRSGETGLPWSEVTPDEPPL